MWIKDAQWQYKSNLSESLEVFCEDLWKGRSYIYVIGSGGKTTLIETLAQEQRALGKKVLVVTTTHMGTPEKYGVFLAGQSPQEASACIVQMLSQEGIAIAGIPQGRGITWIGDANYAAVVALADVLLIEADGSRRHPVKVPAPYEPVINADADLILVVSGMSAIGQPAGEKCHRLSYADEIRRRFLHQPLTDDTILTEGDLICFMEEGYLTPIRKQFPEVPVIPVFNQADESDLIRRGRYMVEQLQFPVGIVGSVRCPKGNMHAGV